MKKGVAVVGFCSGIILGAWVVDVWGMSTDEQSMPLCDHNMLQDGVIPVEQDAAISMSQITDEECRLALIREFSADLQNMSLAQLQALRSQKEREELGKCLSHDRYVHSTIYSYFTGLIKKISQASSMKELADVVGELVFFRDAVVDMGYRGQIHQERLIDLKFSPFYRHLYEKIYPLKRAPQDWFPVDVLKNGQIVYHCYIKGFSGSPVLFSPLAEAIVFLRKLVEKMSGLAVSQWMPLVVYVGKEKDRQYKYQIKKNLYYFGNEILRPFLQGLINAAPEHCIGYDKFMIELNQTISYLLDPISPLSQA